MPEEIFSSIEDIDRALDEEFVDSEEPEEVDEEVEEPTEETPEETSNETDQTESTEEDTEEVKQEPHHYTETEKRNHAFSQMRVENKTLKANIEETNKFLETLAKASGFTDIESMKTGVMKNINAREAEKQGISPEVYDKLNTQQQEIEALKAQQAEATQNQKVARFNDALESVVKQYDFSEQDIQEMFSSLEEDGFTLDSLLSIPNPTYLIKGAFGDKILLAEQQRTLANEKQANLDTTRIDTTTEKDIVSIDDEIEKEMRAYAKENGYHYE